MEGVKCISTSTRTGASPPSTVRPGTRRSGPGQQAPYLTRTLLVNQMHSTRPRRGALSRAGVRLVCIHRRRPHPREVREVCRGGRRAEPSLADLPRPLAGRCKDDDSCSWWTEQGMARLVHMQSSIYTVLLRFMGYSNLTLQRQSDRPTSST